MSEEEWRPVVGIDGYEVSSLGRVRSWKPQSHTARPRSEPKVLRPGRTGRDRRYLAVNLCPGDGSTRFCKVHALVLEAFIGPRPEGAQCRHLDGDSFNNRADNLAWGTARENTDDKRRHGTFHAGENHYKRKRPDAGPRGDTHGRRKLSSAQVSEIRERLRSGETKAQLASAFGMTWFGINNIAKRKVWRHVP